MFKERGQSFEDEYFRKHDAKLIEKLRERARLEEVAEAVAVKLQVDNPELLERIMALGVTLDTAPAFLLAPLVQVAWAGGAVTNREREAVLRVATARGVE
jgi:tellurite resistance protein